MAVQLLACSVRGDDGLGPLGLDEGAQSVAVVGLVGEDVPRGNALKQRWSRGDVALLARRDDDLQWPAARIDDEVDLGR